MAITCDCPMSQPGPTLAAACGGGAFMLFMGLLEVFLRSQCDLEDPCGRAQYRRHMDSVYDFIVVGGGSSGSVVAARLSEVPHWRVLLLEAGFDEPTGSQVPSMFLNFIGSSIDWGYRTEPEPAACLGEDERRCYWPRGKVLGGTSAMNGMMYIRGSRKDYDSWAAAGIEGWSYDDVLPYFIKSEDNKQAAEMDPGYHGTGGPLTVSQFPYHPPLSYSIVKAGEELGYKSRDLNGEHHTGFAIAQTTNRNGSRLSAARAFLRPALRRRNLHVMLNATVTKVLINQKTRQAYAVQLRNSYGTMETIFANNEIILSAGAVASPQLLQLSGVGDPAVLRRAGVGVVHPLPAVGRNLHNHVTHFLSFILKDNNTAPLNWATAMEYLLFRDGLMSGTGISEVTAFINTKYADPAGDNPDIQLFFGGFLADCAKTGMVGESLGGGSRTIQVFPAVLRPKSRGRLEIASSDPFAYPKIYANYLTHPDDVKTLIEGIKFVIKLSETKALKKYGLKLNKTPVKGCEKFKFGCDAYWECAVRMQTGPENHQAGSCRMGPRGDPDAVLDPLLQVQGVDRLRVADASALPAAPSGNTNAACLMLGERAADFIKQRWLSQAYPTGDVSNVLTASESRHAARPWAPWATLQ
ncbi:PREDICTED: glucose dehydrogenase [FAD, quinone] [Papilio polytes]|uniref:glucose dehydrogenase [FAD, quinone] n=1 Tax=Papilio polytes TaxID=76194 RepID=UPI00067604DA|nr:PREDICTED: glucose dehydrogenase [FAD, quinone] [Papilio polytes]